MTRFPTFWTTRPAAPVTPTSKLGVVPFTRYTKGNTYHGVAFLFVYHKDSFL